jgi:hypothetical protein
MSMMSGGANMVAKDYVRAFDLFTSSVIGSMVRWNMELNEDPEIKGDYNVVAKGNISLVAKEARGMAIDQMWATLTPEERLRFKDQEVLIERLKARDLPLDLLETKAVGDKKVADAMQAQQMAAQIDQGLTQAKTQKLGADTQKAMTGAQIAAEQSKAQIAEILSRVESNLANAKTTHERSSLEQIKTLITGVQKDEELRQKAATPAKPKGPVKK